MAATVAKQYGAAMPGTSGTPSATNKYVTDADPRFTTVATLVSDVETLEEESVSIEEVLGLARWLAQRVALLEAIVGTTGAIETPPEAVLVEGYEEAP